jgi:dienelactone hydrolase
MNPQFALFPISTNLCKACRALLVLCAAAFSFLVPNTSAAQMEAPGVSVTISGIDISGIGKVGETPGRFAISGAAVKAPAVLILHGAAGVDGRGAFYATALQKAGIATLEITMFPPGMAPEAPRLSLPHAVAALKWLASQPNVDAQRLGVMGFSFGGVISLFLASELVQERVGKDVPKPAAFAPFYPLCAYTALMWALPQNPFHNAHARMGASPMLIHVGTRDDYEDSERACDAFVASWPLAARERVTVRYVEGATHSFDVAKAMQFYDRTAQAGRGGMVNVAPSPKDAAESREATVRFSVKYLNP